MKKPSTNIDVVIIGNILKEKIIFPNKTIGPILGGPAAYASVCASLLGLYAGLVTNIGKDMQYYLIKPILDSGVDIRGVNIKGKYSMNNELTYDLNGRKKVIYKHKSSKISIEDIPKAYRDPKVFFICPMSCEVTDVTIYKLKLMKKMLMVDMGGLGGTPSVFHPINAKKEQLKRYFKLLNCFDIVKVSEEDCKFIFKENLSYREIINLFHSYGPKIVILTLGKKGSILSEGKRFYEIPIYDTNTIDTTGVGDVFCAAFLASFIKKGDLFYSGKYATVAAVILTEKSGGVEIERFPSKEIMSHIFKQKLF